MTAVVPIHLFNGFANPMGASELETLSQRGPVK